MTVIIASECVSCGSCLDICANDAISIIREEGGYGIAQIDREKCTECGSCLEHDCPGDAIISI